MTWYFILLCPYSFSISRQYLQVLYTKDNLSGENRFVALSLFWTGRYVVLGDSHSVLFLFLPPIYGLTFVRESIEDQMGILSLIYGKSGVSLSMAEQRMLSGSPSSSQVTTTHPTDHNPLFLHCIATSCLTAHLGCVMWWEHILGICFVIWWWFFPTSSHTN